MASSGDQGNVQKSDEDKGKIEEPLEDLLRSLVKSINNSDWLERQNELIASKGDQQQIASDAGVSGLGLQGLADKIDSLLFPEVEEGGGEAVNTTTEKQGKSEETLVEHQK